MKKFTSDGKSETASKIYNNIKEFKIAVIGKSLVGKSALTFRFINDRFPTEHDTTIEDQYRIDINIDGYDCRLGKFIYLDILDTAGQDDYQTMLDSWISYVDGFVLVYSIDDRESYEVLKNRYDRILKNKPGECPCMIMVGNKCDLEGNRKVQKKSAEDNALNLGIKFIEASALEKINIKEVFLSVARDLLHRSLRVVESQEDKKNRCYCF
jgi:small GTP-binding protein